MNRHIQRLTESAEVRAAKDVPTPVIVDSKPQEIFRCPHCKDEIHEKHTYVEEGIERHSDCGGAIQWPPTDWSKIDPQWRALLEPHAK
jgi:hypothetical protein